jgi:hypothetical protein
LSWSPVFPHFKDPYQIVISPLDAKTLLVVTGTPAEANRVYVSHDGGARWREARGLPQNAPLVEQYFPAHQFYAAFDPRAAGTILLADHDPKTNDILIFRSVDGARRSRSLARSISRRPSARGRVSKSRRRTDRALPSRVTTPRGFYGNRLAFDPQAPPGRKPALILTTRFGAFESFDTGSRWRRIDTDAIPHHFIGVQWVNGLVYLASFGGGVIRSSEPLR